MAKAIEGIDWGTDSDRGYYVVSIGPDPPPETVQAFRDAYELGSAWAEAEAALPEGWRLESLERGGMDVRYVVGGIDRLEWWEATARGPFDRRQLGKDSTPVRALRALASRLR